MLDRGRTHKALVERRPDETDGRLDPPGRIERTMRTTD